MPAPDLLTGPLPIRHASRHEQIAAYLREQILSGVLAPEARLPSTQELAKRWGAPIATVQAAFAPLVKEGLLLRRPGFGTVVRGRLESWKRIAIYQPAKHGWDGGSRFASLLADTLEGRLAAQGLVPLRTVDRRQEAERITPLPDLVQAVRCRQVDAVIACESDHRITPWLNALPVPVAIYGSDNGPKHVWFDFADYVSQGVGHLAAAGCRRIGLVSVLPQSAQAGSSAALFHEAFSASLAAHGLQRNPRLVSTPSGDLDERDAERFGYERMRSLWQDSDRPDGVLVYTDRTARGAVMGLLSLGADAAPPRLVLHRNAELGLFCPLPAAFLEISSAIVASALIDALRSVQPEPQRGCRLLPFRLVQDDPVAAAPER